MKEIFINENPLILIIDDNKESLDYLCDIFYDYRTVATTSGFDGINLANSLNPDLILLDIIMPEINGFEVCKLIKSNTQNTDVPIIFLSGKADINDVLEGLKVGAVDYIRKPFQFEELRLRVKNMLELKASKDLIKVQNSKMTELNEDLKQFMSKAIHDLKNSLLVINGFTKLMYDSYTKLTDDDKIDILNDINETGSMMLQIITNLNLIEKLEENSIVPYYSEIDLPEILNNSIELFKSITNKKSININLIMNVKQQKIVQDFTLISESINNLISNAVKFSPNDTNITIIAYSDTINKDMVSKVIIEVIDEGAGIKESEQHLIFKKFAKISSKPSGRELTTGLGLAITKLITLLLNAEIEFESQIGKGSKFTLKFPANGIRV